MGQDMFSSSRRTGITAILFSFKEIPPVIEKTGIRMRRSAPRYPFSSRGVAARGGSECMDVTQVVADHVMGKGYQLDGAVPGKAMALIKPPGAFVFP